MNKENLNFNINLNFGNNNSGEVPFITISNSKSNSSKNQNSKTSSNKYKSSLTNNNNSSSNSKNNRLNSSLNIIRKKLSRNNNNNNEEQKSSEIIAFTDNSLIKPYFDTSFNNLNKYSSNISLQEDEKEIDAEIKNETKTEIKEKNQEIETPKKKCDNHDMFFTKYKKIKKSVPTNNNNIHGKNLMDYFKYMNTNVISDDKNSNRVSSVENISNNTIKLNKKVINTNKSWNKNNKNKKPVKIKSKYKKSCSKNKTKIQKFNINIYDFSRTQKKKSKSNLKFSSVKNIRNHNNYFDNLLNKYFHFKNKNNKNAFTNFQKHSTNNNNICYLSGINNINIEKKINFEKIKITPKTDSYKRKLSASSYLKIRESASKNLFHDYKPKQNEEININQNIHFDKKRLSVKVVKEKKQVASSNLFFKIINNRNSFFKIKPNKKEVIENKNNINIKKINTHNESNSIFFKFKDKKEIMKPNDKNNNHQINKGFNFINRNIKK